MIRWLLISAGAGLLLGGLVSMAGCYDHNQPSVSCAANPYAPGCYPPVHDQRKPR